MGYRPGPGPHDFRFPECFGGLTRCYNDHGEGEDYRFIMRKPSFCWFTGALSLFSVLALVLLTAACGGGGASSTTPEVSITISPTTATVGVGATQQFTATVSGTTSTGVAWQVNGVTGGNASVGTISTSGLYTAPAVPLTPNTVTVTAIALVDTTKTASATVTIPLPTGMSVAPATANVAVGSTLKFTATINGQATNAVNWFVNDIAGGNSTIGTIDTTGGYTAPAVIPTPAAVTVAAVSQADNTQKATAVVTVTKFSAASLKGSFTFVVSGVDRKGSFRLGGVFTADGNGTITAGKSDFVQGNSVQLGKALTGTYGIDPLTGIGTAHLDTGAGPFDLTFAMSGHDHAYWVESGRYGNADGYIQRQSTPALSNAVNGAY